MNNSELYDKVISAYQSGDEHSIVAAARNWIAGAENAPFDNVEARELFSAAKRHYSIWQSGAISCRISKQRMVACVKKIAEMGLDNPYVTKVVEPAEKEEKPTEVVGEKKQYVFGVLPEEPKPTDPIAHIGFEKYDNTENKPAEPKKIFGKKNKKR